MNELSWDTFLSAIEDHRRPLVIQFLSRGSQEGQRLEQPFYELAEEFADMDFAVLDADLAPQAAWYTGLVTLPTFIAFHRGREVNRLHADYAKSDEQVRAFLHRVKDDVAPKGGQSQGVGPPGFEPGTNRL